MQKLRTYRAIINILMIVLMLTWQIGQPLQAATFVWTLDVVGPNNWNSASNWSLTSGTSTAGFPTLVDDIANLTNNITANQTVNLSQVITLGTLNLGDSDGTNTFTLAAGTGGYLIMDVSSGSAAINKDVAANANDIISTGIQFNDTLAVTNNSTTGSLTFSGGLRSNGSDITFNGAGAINVTTAGIVTGGNFIKNDAGTTTLSIASTYAGSTTVNGGTLKVGLAAAIPVRSAITIAAGAALDLLDTVNTLGSLTGAGTLTSTPTAARITTIGRDDTSTTFTGRILAPATPANLAITKIGAGTLTLQPQLAVAAGNYTGNTIINGGKITLDTSASTLTTGFLATTPLQVTGGNFEMIGRSGASVTQTMGNFTLGATGGSITITPNGGTSTILRLGSVTTTAAGGALLVTAPANTIVSNTTTALTNNILGAGRAVFTDGTANTYNWLSQGSTTPFQWTGLGTGVGTTPAYTGALPLNGTGVSTGNYTVSGSQIQNTAASTINTLKITATGVGQAFDLSTFNLAAAGMLITGTDAY